MAVDKKVLNEKAAEIKAKKAAGKGKKKVAKRAGKKNGKLAKSHFIAKAMRPETAAARKKVLAQYNADKSVAEISKSLKLSPSAVQWHIRHRNDPMNVRKAK